MVGPVHVRGLEETLQRNLTELALRRVDKGRDHLGMLGDDRCAEGVELLAAHGLRGQLDCRRKDAFLNDDRLFRPSRRHYLTNHLGQLDLVAGAQDPATSLVAEVLLGDPAALVGAVVCLPQPVRFGRGLFGRCWRRRISRRLDGCREHVLFRQQLVSEKACAWVQAGWQLCGRLVLVCMGNRGHRAEWQWVSGTGGWVRAEAHPQGAIE